MIQVENLTKLYGSKAALQDVSFSIAGGEIIGLLGLNGAGKSTTMNILTGYISPTSGTATINGFNIVTQPQQAKAHIGYLPESLAFYNEMQVGEYLHFICDLKNVKGDRRQHLDAICKKVGIDSMKNRMIRNLSKGYRQRVGIAQALVGNPKVLILDEPTVGLDPSQIIEIRNLIKQVGKDTTVIISSHILTEIQTICSRVLVLYGGRLVADAPTEHLGGAMQSPHKLRIRVQGQPDEIQAALKKLGSTVHIKKQGVREAGSCDFEVTSGNKQDIRAELFGVLSRAQLPLLYSQGGDQSLEDSFLGLIHEQQEHPSKKEASGR